MLYGGLLALRDVAYRFGVLSEHRVSAVVFSVGNLSVGGSGKTPFVALLAQQASGLGLPAAILTRGHGRGQRSEAIVPLRVERATDGSKRRPLDPWVGGDEPVWLAEKLPGTPVYVGADRLKSARQALRESERRVLILDDGFQHRRLARDCNIVLIDAFRGFGQGRGLNSKLNSRLGSGLGSRLSEGRLLPMGPLREKPSALHRADVIFITKADRSAFCAWQRELRALGVRVPIGWARQVPLTLRRLDGGGEGMWEERPASQLAVSQLRGTTVHALSGIAQPEHLRATLVAWGARVGEMLCFPDHEPYRATATLRRVEAFVAKHGTAEAPRCLTTEKDAVKLRSLLRHGERVWVLRTGLQLEGEAARFLLAAWLRLGYRKGPPLDPRDSLESKGR